MEETKLELQTDILGNQTPITTSLCDRFGIHMYSEEFLKKEQAYKEKQATEWSNNLSCVLENERKDEMESVFQTVISTQSETVLKSDYGVENNEKTNTVFMSFYILLGIVIAGVVLFYIEKRRKGRKKREDYYNDYKL